jgi:hypothetical protein
MKLSGVRGWTKISEAGQRAAVWIKAVKWACIGVLMATALVSSYVFPPMFPGFRRS